MSTSHLLYSSAACLSAGSPPGSTVTLQAIELHIHGCAANGIQVYS